MRSYDHRKQASIQHLLTPTSTCKQGPKAKRLNPEACLILTLGILEALGSWRPLDLKPALDRGSILMILGHLDPIGSQNVCCQILDQQGTGTGFCTCMRLQSMYVLEV